jgi:hypothetical protein
MHHSLAGLVFAAKCRQKKRIVALYCALACNNEKTGQRPEPLFMRISLLFNG